MSNSSTVNCLGGLWVVSRNGAKKETFLKIHSEVFPEFLSNIIGEEIVKSSIKCEMRMFKSEEYKNGKPIDLYAITRERGIKVYVEYQICPSDIYNHIETKIKPIIQNIQYGIIVWVASEFKQSHINMVKQLINKNPRKPINFFAVKINPVVLDLLESFNRGYELNVYNQLGMINQIGSPPLSLVDIHLQMPTSYLVEPYKEEEKLYDFSRYVDRNKYLLARLREEIPYYLNFHTDRKSVEKKTLIVSAGRDAIDYVATVYDDAGKAFVKIRFGKSYGEWYQVFKLHNDLLREKINPDIYFNDGKRSISYYMKSNLTNIPGVVDSLIGVYGKFILFLSPFTYGRRDPTEITNINFYQYNKKLYKVKDRWR